MDWQKPDAYKREWTADEWFNEVAQVADAGEWYTHICREGDQTFRYDVSFSKPFKIEGWDG